MCDDRVHHQDRINLIRSMAFFYVFSFAYILLNSNVICFFYFAFIVIETRDYWSKLKSKANFIDWYVNWRLITIVAKTGHRFRQPFRFDWANYSVVTRDRYNESLKLKCFFFGRLSHAKCISSAFKVKIFELMWRYRNLNCLAHLIHPSVIFAYDRSLFYEHFSIALFFLFFVQLLISFKFALNMLLIFNGT